MDTTVRQALDEVGGMLRRRDHPELATRLDRARARGELVSPLPGVLAAGELLDPEARIRAGALWAGPDAVVCGLAAARLTFWPEVSVPVVELAAPVRGKSRPGWVVHRRTVPPELVRRRGGLPVTAPALTAVDLAAGPVGGEAIDRVLRSRTATLDHLWEALRLNPGRRGNVRRAELLTDSRDQPWSEAERLAHRLLRAAGLRGWRTNVPVGPWFADVVFTAERVIVEIDGFETHGARAAFEQDRYRRDELVLAGYLVLNFTWRQLTEQPDWVLDCIRRALGTGTRR